MMVRPCDLRPGDLILTHGDTMLVTAGPFPIPHPSGHVLMVVTDRGELTWPLADSSRFETVNILPRPAGVPT